MNTKPSKTKRSKGEAIVALIVIVVAIHLPFIAVILPPADTTNPIPEGSTKW